MAYRKRSGNKGRKCIRTKRVRMKGGKLVRRCAKYGPKRKAAKSAKRRPAKRKKATKRRRYAGTSRYSKRGRRGYRPRSGGQAVQGPFMPSGHFYG